MPTYEFSCDKCNLIFEVTKHISDDSIINCPVCKGHVQQNYYSPYVFDASPKTLGTFAEKNTKKMGNYLRSEKNSKKKKRNKPLDLSKIKDVRKYIETGNKW